MNGWKNGSKFGNIESQENNTIFKKFMTVMKYMRTNIQNVGNEELKGAVSDYLI